MPTIPTPNAPVSYDQLVHLLKDDNKVKVAGEYRLFILLGVH